MGLLGVVLCNNMFASFDIRLGVGGGLNRGKYWEHPCPEGTCAPINGTSEKDGGKKNPIRKPPESWFYRNQ